MRFFTFGLFFLTACGSSNNPTSDAGTDGDAQAAFRTECENIADGYCILPFPSNRYLEEADGPITGHRINIPRAAMPINNAGVQVDTAQFNALDGFSAFSSPTTVFRGAINTANLPSETAPAASLEQNSPTLLFAVGDDGSLTRVAHYAEVDRWAGQDPELRPFYLRPLERLDYRRRYIVAIRNLTTTAGTPVEPSAYFRALRDNTPLAGTDIETRRAAIESVLASLTAAGVDRSSLIQAWDFTVGSEENITRDTLTIRDRGLAALAGNQSCAITEVAGQPIIADDVDDNIWRRIEGTIRVPLFLESDDPNTAASVAIHRGTDGQPEQNGFAEVSFIAAIPRSVRERALNGQSSPVLVFGHGLFGGSTEIDSGAVRQTANRLGMVTFAIDWWGMSTNDLGRVINTLREMSQFFTTPTRVSQGLLNFMALADTAKGACRDLSPFSVPRENMPAVNTISGDEVYFYGISQGSIFGHTLAAIAPNIERFALSVGGMGYSHMITRSSNWRTYSSIMELGYPSAFDRSVLMSVAQLGWDYTDPSSYVSHVLQDPFPCPAALCPSGLTPTKRILAQIGTEDVQVATVTAFAAARTMGLPVLTPTTAVPYGLTGMAGPTASALVIYDFPATPGFTLGTGDPGVEGTPAHSGVRGLADAQEQLRRFFLPSGQVEYTCDNGVCD